MAIGKKVKQAREEKERKKAADRAELDSIKRRNSPHKVVELNESTLRTGPLTDVDKALIQRVAEDSPKQMTDEQINGLAVAINRHPNTIRQAIGEARSKFARNMSRYVDNHMLAVDGMIREGQYDSAAKHSEWALEKGQMEGEGVIDAPAAKGEGEGAVKVLLGVQVGGVAKLDGSNQDSH